MKKSFSAIVFGGSIIIASIFLGNAYVDRNKPLGTVQVTGLGKADFTSDLIVWSASFNVLDTDLKKAYAALEEHKQIIKAYLGNKGVPAAEVVFTAVRSNKETKNIYSSSGDYMGEEFVGYALSQNVQIESAEVEKIEQISREITELLNQGITLYSDAPRYYYTKLADLKIEMISKATEDAYLRAQRIAANSGGDLGELQSAKMGVFQITGQNSNENYSWGGTFNTSSKKKTASITMKLVYRTD